MHNATIPRYVTNRPRPVDVKGLHSRVSMTQEQFAAPSPRLTPKGENLFLLNRLGLHTTQGGAKGLQAREQSNLVFASIANLSFGIQTFQNYS
jgi:hypothetical protein